MYSKERAKQIEKKDVKYIPAGIIENVTIRSAEVRQSPKGGTFLEITFEKDGGLLKQTEWQPKMTQFTDTEAKLQDKADTQFARMLQILNCFYTDEELVFEGSTFEEFVTTVAEYINNANKDIKLRVKAVYNKDGYTTLPTYAKYTFIEPMVLPEGKTSAIRELGIDQFVRPVIADKEQAVDMLSLSKDTASVDITDLPF